MSIVYGRTVHEYTFNATKGKATKKKKNRCTDTTNCYTKKKR